MLPSVRCWLGGDGARFEAGAVEDGEGGVLAEARIGEGAFAEVEGGTAAVLEDAHEGAAFTQSGLRS